MKNIGKNKALIASLIVVALAALSISGMVLTESEYVDGDPTVVVGADGVTVVGSNNTTDYDVYANSKVVLNGTYSGTIRLFSEAAIVEKPTLLCTVSLTSANGITIYGSATQPYVTGNMTGTMMLSAGSILLGHTDGKSNKTGFSGAVYGADGSVTCNDIVGMLLTVKQVGGHNTLVVSGDGIQTSNGFGFGIISSCLKTDKYSASEGSDISMQGLISNELLGNSISVSYQNGIYYLSGTLSHIDGSGASSIGTLFDFIMGGKYDYGIVIGLNGHKITESESIKDIGGQALIGVSSSSSGTIQIDGQTINLSGLTFTKGNAPSNQNSPWIPGKIVLNDSVSIENAIFNSDIALSARGNISAAYGANIEVRGSLDVTGSFDATAATGIVADMTGVITSSGTMKTLSSMDTSKTNIHAVYYDSEESGKDIRYYTSLSKAISSQSSHSGAQIHIMGSYVMRSDELIPSGLTLVNDGCLFIDRNAILTVGGTLSNSIPGGVIISTYSYVDTFPGTLSNKGYIIAYGTIKIKGADATSIYADVSHYNNTWTVYSNLKNILDRASPGDTFVLRSDTTVNENLTVPEKVTLNLSNKLDIAQGITLTVNGNLMFNTNMDLGDGKLRIGPTGNATVSSETTLRDIEVSGTLSVDDDAKITVMNSATIGIPPSSLPYSNNVKITGKIALDSAYVLVYGTPNGFSESNIDGTVRSTTMYSGDKIYATEYAVSDRNLFLPTPTLDGLGFIGWYDNSILSGRPISANDEVNVGQYKSIYAYTSDKVYKVTLTYNQGIIWIWENGAAEGIINAVYGPHTVDVDVKNGYTGTPIIYVDGIQIERGSTVYVNKDMTLTVSGVSNAEPGTEIGITGILLTILVLVIIILAATMLYRMKKS